MSRVERNFQYQSYFDMIKDIRRKYLNRKISNEWEDLINKANALLNAGYTFDNNIHPHFYSGNLFKAFPNEIHPIKYLFIAMNPKKRKDINYSDNNELLKLTDQDYLSKQNQNFDIFTKRSQIYLRCQKIIMHLENIQTKPEKYSVLKEKAAVIDWFPFFSEYFKLNDSTNVFTNAFALNLLYPILKLFNDNQVIGFALNRAVKDAIESLADIFNIQDMKKTLETNALQLKELKLSNIEVYKINTSVLCVIPILARRPEPNNDVYKDITQIIEKIFVK